MSGEKRTECQREVISGSGELPFVYATQDVAPWRLQTPLGLLVV